MNKKAKIIIGILILIIIGLCVQQFVYHKKVVSVSYNVSDKALPSNMNMTTDVGNYKIMISKSFTVDGHNYVDLKITNSTNQEINALTPNNFKVEVGNQVLNNDVNVNVNVNSDNGKYYPNKDYTTTLEFKSPNQNPNNIKIDISDGQSSAVISPYNF